MNQQKLVAEVAEQTGLSLIATERTIIALLASIKKSVARGERVRLVNFGTFKRANRKARIGRNPQTNEAVAIPARKVATFTVGKDFQENVL